jgi:DNA-binding protein H-NS
MAERQGGSIIEWLEIDVTKLSGVERVGLIDEIMNMLSAQELGQVRESADKKRAGKLKDARSAFLVEMRQKAEQLDLSFEDVLTMQNETKTRSRKREGAPVKIKYRSPTGEGWSGRGRVPVWLREAEEQGHNREEFLVPPEEV